MIIATTIKSEVPIWFWHQVYKALSIFCKKEKSKLHLLGGYHILDHEIMYIELINLMFFVRNSYWKKLFSYMWNCDSIIFFTLNIFAFVTSISLPQLIIFKKYVAISVFPIGARFLSVQVLLCRKQALKYLCPNMA